MAFGLINGDGQTNVTAQQDADLYAGILGLKPVVLRVGEELRAGIINSNTVRLYDGELVSQGRRIHIDANTYEDFTIENGSQGVVRYDIIGFRIFKDGDVQTAEKFVRKNVGENGVVQEGVLREGAAECQVSAYRVKVNGLSIESVDPLFVKMSSIPLLDVEVVTNNFGQAWKCGDGRLIQFGTLDVTYANEKILQKTLAFPVPFMDKNYVTTASRESYGNASSVLDLIACATVVSASQMAVTIQSKVGGFTLGSPARKAHWMAIGRWR